MLRSPVVQEKPVQWLGRQTSTQVNAQREKAGPKESLLLDSPGAGDAPQCRGEGWESLSVAQIRTRQHHRDVATNGAED